MYYLKDELRPPLSNFKTHRVERESYESDKGRTACESLNVLIKRMNFLVD